MKAEINFSNQDLVEILRQHIITKYKLGQYNTPVQFNIVLDGQEYNNVMINAKIIC